MANGGPMICLRCGGMLGAGVFYFEGSKCTSWSCYRCGNVVDEVILLNRAAGAGRPRVRDSTKTLAFPPTRRKKVSSWAEFGRRQIKKWRGREDPPWSSSVLPDESMKKQCNG